MRLHSVHVIFDLQSIPWMRNTTGLPIVIKGTPFCVFSARADNQCRYSMCCGKIVSVSSSLSSNCSKDAVLAAEAGCEGIVLSNHGGEL